MKTIGLRGGKHAIVDDGDYDALISQGPWDAFFNHKNGNWYARRREKGSKQVPGYSVYMGREILGLTRGDPGRVIYLSKEPNSTLDNRRVNIRIGTRSDQMANMEKRIERKGKRKYSSKYKGVFWAEASQMWRAQIRIVGYGMLSLGDFKTEEEAAREYNKAAATRSYVFARLNKVV